MSFSFVILDLKNELNLSNVINTFNKYYKDYEIIYCATKQVEKIDKVKQYLFDDKECSEKILNTVLKYSTKTNIVVVRGFTSFEEIKKQTNNLLLTNQIVYFKKQLSPIRMFFYKLFRTITKLIFSNDIVFCNFSCTSYGEIASNVLKKIKYPSNLMRTNEWQGIQLVGIDGGKTYKFKYNCIKSILQCCIPLLVSLVCMFLIFIFKNKFNTLSNILFVLIAIIGVLTSIIFGANWFIKSQIGENILEKADIKKEIL